MLMLVENHSLPRPAAFFDLDKTVIAKSSTLTFSKSFYQGGLINRRAALRTTYAQFVFSWAACATTSWSARARTCQSRNPPIMYCYSASSNSR